MDGEIITVVVQLPFRSPVELRVNRYDTVSSIEEKVTLPKLKLILFKSYLLSPNFSFNFYGITDNSKLYIFPFELPSFRQDRKDGEPAAAQSTRSQTPPPMPIEPPIPGDENAKSSMFPREMARLKDQFFRKVEGTVMCHRKLLHRFVKLIDNNGKEDSEDSPIVIPKTPTEPSTGILPNFWSGHSDNI